MRFRSVVELGGKTATGVWVPEGIFTKLGSGKRPAVNVTTNGYTYRSTVAPMGGVFMSPVSAEVRANAGVAAGDHITVDVELDTEPREVTVPPDLIDALDQNAGAKQFFTELSYSNKRRIVLSIDDAKTNESRRRRIEEAVAMVAERRI